MIDLTQYEVWFVVGSQHLYGPETLEQVAVNSKEIAEALDASAQIPTRVVFKPVLTTPDAIYQVCQEANQAENCVGLIAWISTRTGGCSPSGTRRRAADPRSTVPGRRPVRDPGSPGTPSRPG